MREGCVVRHFLSSCCDVWVGQRPVLKLPRILALEPQRLRIVTLKQSDKEREREERVRAQFEKLDVVMRRQRLALFIGEPLPGAAFAFGQIQDDIGLLGFPPGDGSTWVFAVALNQRWVAVDGKEELVEEIFAHASTPFVYQVK